MFVKCIAGPNKNYACPSLVLESGPWLCPLSACIPLHNCTHRSHRNQTTAGRGLGCCGLASLPRAITCTDTLPVSLHVLLLLRSHSLLACTRPYSCSSSQHLALLTKSASSIAIMVTRASPCTGQGMAPRSIASCKSRSRARRAQQCNGDRCMTYSDL